MYRRSASLKGSGLNSAASTIVYQAAATDPDGAREAVYDHDWFKLRPPSAEDFALIDDIGIGASMS